MHDPDEINLLEYVYVLVKAKWWIVGATVLGLIIGYVAALIKGPTYVAEAIIAPKESQSAQKGPNLSGLGMLGGVVASQLNLGGNPGLDKIDVILDSKKFHAEMAEEYKLYPVLFPDVWDPVNNKWAVNVQPPKPLSVGGYIILLWYIQDCKHPNVLFLNFVIPAKAGIQLVTSGCTWIPASAGMTDSIESILVLQIWYLL